MTTEELEKLINSIVEKGIEAVEKNGIETDYQIDYVAIFAKDEKEFEEIDTILQTLATRDEKSGLASTGNTYRFSSFPETKAGLLQVVKIRKPDEARPQRGAPDFRVAQYRDFKNRYLSNNNNMTLMIRKDFEMIELKGKDVLVYFPSISFAERQR